MPSSSHALCVPDFASVVGTPLDDANILEGGVYGHLVLVGTVVRWTGSTKLGLGAQVRCSPF